MRVTALALVLIFLFSLVPGRAEGQDSLIVNAELSQKRLNDSTRAAELLRSAEKYSLSGVPDSAVANIRRSLEIASYSDFYLIELSGYELLALIYDNQSEWENALLNYHKALLICNSNNFTEREITIFRILADKYFNLGIYKQSAYYYEQEFSMYGKDNVRSRAQAAESAGLSYFSLPDDSLAAIWLSKASDNYELTGDTDGMTRCYRKLASLFIRMGKYNPALEKYDQVMDIFSGLNDNQNIASVYNNTGYLKFKLHDYNNALSDFLSAAKYSGKSSYNPSFLTDVYSNIAICNQTLDRDQETLQNFQTALIYAREAGEYDQIARIDNLLAVIYFKREDYYHADLYSQECIESSKQAGAYSIMQEGYKTWSEIKEQGNDFVKALEYYEKYLSIRDSLNIETRMAERKEVDRQAEYEVLEQRTRLTAADQEIQGLALKNMKAESLRKENEMKLLLKQQELDSSEKQRLAQSLALEQEKRVALENQQKVSSLEQERMIQQLELDKKTEQEKALQNANMLLETEKNQQQMKAEKERQIRKMTVGLGILVALVALMFLFGLISTRKKNQKLAESKLHIEKINTDLEIKNREVLEQNEKISVQKDIIEQKNQSITDSIQYASRIQAAVLPPEDFLSEWDIENFVLYKPKAIVSGDFYWGVRKNGSVILAAADCTGHGVPGAFMSMLGHAFLDEIINTTNVGNAAEILDLLREVVINTLKQRGMVGEARDGMDISLCIIDRHNWKLDYAGANNPLYLIRDGKLTKFPADRMPIGIHVSAISPFTNNNFEIQKGDYLYLFSDGYADQFGGPSGRKFMYKPFQDLLLNNHLKPMKAQKDILEETFVSWKGEYDQVDDVLVMGLRL
jgi:serine phosphatase RsbU (regulator of sigma subunit)